MTYNPAPKKNYIPIVLTNNTTLPDTEVYVLFEGKYKYPNGGLFFFQLTEFTSPPMGVYAPVTPATTTLSTNYSYQLSTLPRSSTGPNDYLVYVPNCPSNRFYFSINSPMFLESDASPNNISAPSYFAFYDPNYSNIYESVEMAFIPDGGTGGDLIPWTASMNTTEVDAFGFPIRIQYQSYAPATPTSVTPMVQDPNALPSGFGVGGLSGATTRSTIITSILNSLTTGDLTLQPPKIWPKLALPFYTNPYAGSGLQTYLRVLSPKQSVGGSAAPSEIGGLTSQHLPTVQPGPTQFLNYNYPPFPMNYLTANTYGNANSFADNLMAHYTSGTTLYISTGGGTPTVYQGVTTGSTPNQVMTFTGISGSHTGQVNTINESDINTFKMYSGSQLMTGGSDGDLLGFYFGDAFTVGLIGGAVGTQNSGPPPNDPINVTDAVTWEPFYTPMYYTAQYAFSGGPWMDLYSDSLHHIAVRNSVGSWLNGVGLCYGYDFDDSLGFSGTITPASTTLDTLSPYLSVTLGEIDTSVPDPYSDSTAYSVTFNFPSDVSHALQYSQGGGPYINVTNGSTVPGLVSSRSNKLNLHYTNGQGPTGDHYFDVYLYYQFIQPTSVYNGFTTGIINSTTINPNSATPTSFTINLLP